MSRLINFSKHLLLLTLFILVSSNHEAYSEGSPDLDVGIHVFAAERVYENSGQFSHQGVGELSISISLENVTYSELYLGGFNSKFDISQEHIRLNQVQKISREHYVFEGVNFLSGAKVTGFIKKENSKLDFEILGYYVSGELAYKIQPLHSDWARKIVEKFPDIDFGQ